jgi:putative sugar O-methyltransferase
MNFAHDLILARKDLAAQDSLYQPTAFWSRSSAEITENLLKEDVKHFRSNTNCLRFFVPNYGGQGNGISVDKQMVLLKTFKEQIPDNPRGLLAFEQYLSGRAEALADFRVLQATDDPSQLPRLDRFSESKVGRPIGQHEIEGRRYSRSALNYLLGLAMLKRYIGRHAAHAIAPCRVLEIGGGFGSLGEILSQADLTNWRYIDIDIPPTGIVAEWYLRQALGEDQVIGYAQTREQIKIEVDALPPVAVLMPWQLPLLKGTVDLFVNFISFQEMEPPIVENYLRLVSQLGPEWILLRNLQEGKQRRQRPNDIGVDEPIKGNDYAAMLPNYDMVERGTIPFGYSTVDGFHSELLLFRLR